MSSSFKQSMLRAIAVIAIAFTRESIAFTPHVSKAFVPRLPSIQVPRDFSLSTKLFAQKIAYVNTANVFQSIPQREAVLSKMQTEFKEKAKELESLQLTAKAKIEKLKRSGELLGPDEVEKLRREIAELDSKYKIKAQSLEKASMRREAEEKKKLFDMIEDAVKKVAEKEGYDMVIDIATLQYGNGEYDITENVSKALQ